MKTPSERGPIGAWAYQARQEAGLSVEQVAAQLSERGHAISPATLRGIESGSKKPGARLQRLLAQVLESTPPGEPQVRAADPAAELLERQVNALEEQNEWLRRYIEQTDGRITVLERLVESFMTGSSRPPATTPDPGDQEWAERADAESRRQRSARPASTG